MLAREEKKLESDWSQEAYVARVGGGGGGGFQAGADKKSINANFLSAFISCL